MHDDVVADQPDLRAALDLALGHAAARHFAHLRDGEHFEDFGVAEEGLAQVGASRPDMACFISSTRS